jgi:hypothetical protein
MNTQEKEPELGEGVTSAEFWMYDGKLGRRWNVDPEFARSPWFSSYMTFGGNPVLNIDLNGDYFGGSIGSTTKQRKAAKEVAKITGGKVNKCWSKNINVTWAVKDKSQGEYSPKEVFDDNGNLIPAFSPVSIKSSAADNRRTAFNRDGSTKYTQKKSNGKWEDVLFEGEKDPWQNLNESGFVGRTVYEMTNSFYLTGQMFRNHNPTNLDGTFASSNQRVLGFAGSVSWFVPSAPASKTITKVAENVIDDVAKIGVSPNVQKVLNTLNDFKVQGGTIKLNPLNPTQEINMTFQKGTQKLDVRIETHTLPQKYGGNGLTPQRHLNVDLYPNKKVLPNSGHKILE